MPASDPLDDAEDRTEDRGAETSAGSRRETGAAVGASSSIGGGRSIAVPLGFFEWLLVGYLVTSGLVHLFFGLRPLLDDDPLDRFHAFRIATGAFSLLLTGQLLHRIPVARYSIALILIMQIGLFLKRYAVEAPFLWTELAPLERAQKVTEFGFWMVALILVLARPWRVARYADLPGNDVERLLR